MLTHECDQVQPKFYFNKFSTELSNMQVAFIDLLSILLSLLASSASEIVYRRKEMKQKVLAKQKDPFKIKFDKNFILR